MPDEALQAAFEIKAACDDISRKLLRWHWAVKRIIFDHGINCHVTECKPVTHFYLFIK